MRKFFLVALNLIGMMAMATMAFAAPATLDAAGLGSTCVAAAIVVLLLCNINRRYLRCQ